MERQLRVTLPEGRFHNVLPKDSAKMRAVRGKGNRSTELRFQMALVRAGIEGWETGTVGIPGKPDFLFRSKRLAVFVDGCFWHGCPKCGHIPKKNSSFWQMKIELTRSRDIKSTNRLREMGYSVLRFWEHELRGQLRDCISTLETIITT